MNSLDGPFCFVYQPVTKKQVLLEAALRDIAHVRFASTEAELTNLVEEVFRDVEKRLIVICLSPQVSDFNGLMLARRIRRMTTTNTPIVITCEKFGRTWSEPGVSFITTDDLAEASKQLLAA